MHIKITWASLIVCTTFSRWAFVVSNAFVNLTFCVANFKFWAFTASYLVVHSSICRCNSACERFLAAETPFAGSGAGTRVRFNSLHAYGNISYKWRSSIGGFNTVFGWAYQNWPNSSFKLLMYVLTSYFHRNILKNIEINFLINLSRYQILWIKCSPPVHASMDERCNNCLNLCLDIVPYTWSNHSMQQWWDDNY